MLSLATIGFLVIIAILYFMMSKKLSAVVALITIPILGALAAGHGASVGKYIQQGLVSMAPTGVMFIFSILFFGVMRDVGAFDPIVDRIIRVAKGRPLYVAIGTYLIGIIGHLDGAGATTFLLVVPAMLPIYDKLKMNRLVLACITAMAAGTMNLTPWGGPTLRAATALQMDVMALYQPIIIPQLCGLLTGLIFAWYLGMKETKRLRGENVDIDLEAIMASKTEVSEEELALKRPKLIAFNILLIVFVIGIMIASIVNPATAFMIGTAIAMIVNYPDAKIQRERVDAHATEAMLMASVLFAAGVLMGILKGSGMAKEMAQAMVSIVPEGSGSIITLATGYLSVPMSLLFDPDSYYFGVMPIIAESVAVFGIPAADIARASIAGQITVGFPISPLTPSTFLLIGLAGVELGDHQKFTFKYLWAISIVIMTAMVVMGVFTL